MIAARHSIKHLKYINHYIIYTNHYLRHWEKLHSLSALRSQDSSPGLTSECVLLSTAYTAFHFLTLSSFRTCCFPDNSLAHSEIHFRNQSMARNTWLNSGWKTQLSFSSRDLPNNTNNHFYVCVSLTFTFAPNTSSLLHLLLLSRMLAASLQTPDPSWLLKVQTVRAVAPKFLCTAGPKDPLQAGKRPLPETLTLPHPTCLI